MDLAPATNNFPPIQWCTVSRPYCLSPGDIVWIRKQKSYGKVLESVGPLQWSIEPINGCTSSPVMILRQREIVPAPAYIDQYQDASKVVVVVTPETGVFRLLAEVPLTSSSGYGVLEVGSSTGKTSEILWKHCSSWLGWDSGTDMVQTVQTLIDDDRNSGCRRMVARVNLLDEPTMAERMLCSHFRVDDDCDTTSNAKLQYIFIDIGGDRCYTDVLVVLQWLMRRKHCWQTRPAIIIKNKALHAQLVRVDNPCAWFAAQADKAASAAFSMPSHPLQAERRTVPGSDLSICRYHNYHVDGCKKTLDESCPFDHTHCHWCRQPGHRAIECPTTTSPCGS